MLRKPHQPTCQAISIPRWTTDGKLFDGSVVRGEPTEFPLNGVIRGRTEGVRLMVVGDKTRFWIPGELAYGNSPSLDLLKAYTTPGGC